MKTSLLLLGILAVAAALPSAFAANTTCSAGSSSWATFFGNVTINTNTSTSGALVRAYANNDTTNNSKTVVGLGGASGKYNIVVCGGSGDQFHFRVWDLNASPTNGSPQVFPGVGEYRQVHLVADTKANGGTCTFAQSCTSGFCTDSFCCNSACGGGSEDCNVAGSAGTCTSTATTTSSTTGGGGGSAATTAPTPAATSTATPAATTPSSSTAPSAAPTAEPTPEVPVTEVIIVPEVVAEVPVTIEIQNKQETGVQTIAIITSSGASNVAFTVEKTESKPTGIAPPPTDKFKVFSYLKIEATIAKESVKEAQITFTVTKQWLKENGLGKEGVALGRLGTDNIWRELPTDIVGDDSETVTYVATTPGFSYFAVMAKTSVVATPEPVPVPQDNGMLLFAGIVAIVVIIAIIFVLKKKK